MKSLPPRGSSDAPHYWMYETGGVLKPIVAKYLQGEDLTGDDCSWLRAYLRQWINSPVWNDDEPSTRMALADLRQQVDLLTSRVAIDLWTNKAFDLGIDPW